MCHYIYIQVFAPHCYSRGDRGEVVTFFSMPIFNNKKNNFSEMWCTIVKSEPLATKFIWAFLVYVALFNRYRVKTTKMQKLKCQNCRGEVVIPPGRSRHSILGLDFK